MASAAGGSLAARHAEEARLHKPTDDMENIDLNSVAGSRRGGHAGLGSTFRNTLLSWFTKYDIEIIIGLLIIIFCCTVFAIFTRDAGWFVLDVPFHDSDKVAFIAVGLQTYTVSIDGGAASTAGRVVAIKQMEISSLSPEAHSLGAFLYVCLLCSLLLTVGMLWYIALFYSYLKGCDPRADKELAVRLLGALGIILAVLLFSVGTCSYSKRIEEDFAEKLPSTVKSLSSLDTSAMGVQDDYAYELTVAAWFFWILAGTLFLIRRLWARRKSLDEHHLTALDELNLP